MDETMAVLVTGGAGYIGSHMGLSSAMSASAPSRWTFSQLGFHGRSRAPCRGSAATAAIRPWSLAFIRDYGIEAIITSPRPSGRF